MVVAITNEKTQLAALEQATRTAANRMWKNGFAVGEFLSEIRGQELWKSEGYKSWTAYLADNAERLVGYSAKYAAQLTAESQMRGRFPASMAATAAEISPRGLRELCRLAPLHDDPDRKYRDIGAIQKRVVAAVLKEALGNSNGFGLTSLHLRAAVDSEMGIDRAAQAKKTKADNALGRPLHSHLTELADRLEWITTQLQPIPADVWTLLEEEHPGLATRVAAAGDDLATLLRSKVSGKDARQWQKTKGKRRRAIEMQ